MFLTKVDKKLSGYRTFITVISSTAIALDVSSCILSAFKMYEYAIYNDHSNVLDLCPANVNTNHRFVSNNTVVFHFCWPNVLVGFFGHLNPVTNLQTYNVHLAHSAVQPKRLLNGFPIAKCSHRARRIYSSAISIFRTGSSNGLQKRWIVQ